MNYHELFWVRQESFKIILYHYYSYCYFIFSSSTSFSHIIISFKLENIALEEQDFFE